MTIRCSTVQYIIISIYSTVLHSTVQSAAMRVATVRYLERQVGNWEESRLWLVEPIATETHPHFPDPKRDCGGTSRGLAGMSWYRGSWWPGVQGQHVDTSKETKQIYWADLSSSDKSQNSLQLKFMLATALSFGVFNLLLKESNLDDDIVPRNTYFPIIKSTRYVLVPTVPGQTEFVFLLCFSSTPAKDWEKVCCNRQRQPGSPREQGLEAGHLFALYCSYGAYLAIPFSTWKNLSGTCILQYLEVL